MAEMLRDTDSTQKHLTIAYRHQRLVRKAPGGAAYADRLEAPRKRLDEAARRSQDAELAVDLARDDLSLADAEQDNRVRTLFERASQHDRENPGARVREMLFPQGGFTPVTMATAGTAAATEVEQLGARLEKLGEEHALREQLAGLQQSIAATRQTVTAIEEATRAVALARADEELAQAAVRAQYEANYLDLRKALGKAVAERYFPPVRNRSPKTRIQDEAPEPAAEG